MKHLGVKLKKAALLSLPLLLSAPALSHAHGYISQPLSRAVMCDKQGGFWSGTPPTKGCEALKNSGDWQRPLTDKGGSVYQGAGYLNYQQTIKDGELCSSNYKALNAVVPKGDWATTAVTPDANGNIDLSYLYTAYHGTDHIAFFITKQTYDPSKPLKWSDLEPLYKSPGANIPGNDRQVHFKAKLPHGQTGRHVIYAVWPVSAQHGTQEAFTTCADVVIKDTGAIVAPWTAVGEGLNAVQQLNKNQQVMFRLFDEKTRGSVAFETTFTANSAMEPAQWLYSLAKQVNSGTDKVRIGTLKGNDVALESAQAFYNVYAKRGDYTYALYIQDPDQDEDHHPLPAPIANAGSDLTVVATFTADSGWPYKLDGSKSSGQDLKYQWDATGPFPVRNATQALAQAFVPRNTTGKTTYRLTVTDKNGNKATATKVITAVSPAVSVTGKTQAGAGEAVSYRATANFTGTQENPVIYEWSLLSGSTQVAKGTGQSWKTPSNLKAGSYNVQVKAKSNHGQRSAAAATTLTVSGSQGDGATCAVQWARKAYPGGSKVTHQGRTYIAKWWAEPNNVPGDPSVTDTTGNSTGWGLVWEDKGLCK